MNILQILPELNVGGVETGTVDLAKCLIQAGHSSFVISNGGSLVPELEKKGTKHFQLPVHKKTLWTITKMIKKVHTIIKEEKVDIVHARSRVPAWIAYFASLRTRAQFVTTCHGYYKNKLFSQVMGWGKLIIVPSEAIGRHMIDDFNVSLENIRCIPRSVDIQKFKFKKKIHESSTDKIVAIVGRITRLKGHDYFLKAMAQVIRTLPYVKIWIIGDVPKKKEAYKHELELLVSRLGIKNHVEFLGARGDVPELLSKVDVCVLSTVTQEAFGRVILEAQAVGVPVVATQVGGVVDIIDHEKTGLLVLPKDVEAMSKAVLRLLRDDKLVEELVVQAKAKLKEKFTLTQMASKTMDVYDEIVKTKNILVIKLSSLGDVILISGSLKALRKKFPAAKIYCLVDKESRQILSNCPYLDGLIIFDSSHKDSGWINVWKFSKQLRKHRFDQVIDFQNNRKSHLLSFLSLPKESIGFNNGKWSSLLSQRVDNFQKNTPAVVQQFQILQKVGIKYKEEPFLEMWPSEKDKQYAQDLLEMEWLGNSKKMVGINVSASLKWKTKNWPIEHMARLCDILSQKNIRVVLTGESKDQGLVRELLRLTKSKPANLAGKTSILQLAALMKFFKVYLTPDSAPMHIAAAMQTPLVTLFGPTDSGRHIPPARKIVVLEKKLNCAPCYGRRCKILTHACMKGITPEQVAHEIDALIESAQ